MRILSDADQKKCVRRQAEIFLGGPACCCIILISLSYKYKASLIFPHGNTNTRERETQREGIPAWCRSAPSCDSVAVVPRRRLHFSFPRSYPSRPPLLALIHPPYQSLERNTFFSVLFKRRTCIVVVCAWPTRPPPFRILTARSLVVPRSELAMGADEVATASCPSLDVR